MSAAANTAAGRTAAAGTRRDPLLSVVVIAHNEESTLPVLLDALAAQTLASDRFEVLVVDDGSTDRTAVIARSRDFVTLLGTPGGLGDAARNVALRQSRGRVIAITDADCRPEPDWLERSLEELDRLGVDVVVGHIEVPLSERPSLAEKLDYCRYLDQERSVKEIGFGATANVVLRRSVFDRIGMFNERLYAAGDREFGMRAVDAGVKVAYSARAIVHHPPRSTARGLMYRCYRAGVAGSHLIKYGSGPARKNHLVWLHPGAWIPRFRADRIYGIARLHRLGYRPSRLETLRLGLAQWLYTQLPLAIGSIVGTIRGSRTTRRASLELSEFRAPNSGAAC